MHSSLCRMPLPAGKQEKGIDEQRQVRHEGDVKCTVFFDGLPADAEVVGEVQAGRGLPALVRHARSIAGLRRMAAGLQNGFQPLVSDDVQ